jgi:hypothetical protein
MPEKIDAQLIAMMAKASHAAALRYYDGKRKPSNNPMATHRFIQRAVLKELRLQGYDVMVSR